MELKKERRPPQRWDFCSRNAKNLPPPLDSRKDKIELFEMSLWNLPMTQMWLAELPNPKVDEEQLERFREEKVEGRHLPSLTEEHLKILGFATIGDRLDMSRAIKSAIFARSRYTQWRNILFHGTKGMIIEDAQIMLEMILENFTTLDYETFLIDTVLDFIYGYSRHMSPFTNIPNWSYDCAEIASREEIFQFKGHNQDIRGLAIDSSDSFLFSASVDRKLKMWDIHSGECVRTYEGHSDEIWAMLISNNDQYVFTGSNDKTVKMWRIETGECVKTYTGHEGPLMAMCLTKDERGLVTSGNENKIRVFDVESTKQLWCWEAQASRTWTLALTSDDSRIVTGGPDKVLRLWNFKDGPDLILSFEGHEKRVMNCLITRDDTTLISASEDKFIHLWNMVDGSVKQRLSGHTGTVRWLDLTRNETLLFSGSYDNSLKMWEMATGKCLATFKGHGSTVTGVLLNHSETRLFSGSSDNTIKMWYLAGPDDSDKIDDDLDNAGGFILEYDTDPATALASMT